MKYAIVAIILVSVFVLFDRGYARLNYPALERFPVRGIDVSHHQKEIDWAKVKSEGIEFVFIKATEGGSHLDSKFDVYWNGAKSVGLLRGAYHFFTFCRAGLDQAKNFLTKIARESGTLPVVLDLEFLGNCKKRPPVEELAVEVKNFVAEIQKIDPREPIFYVTTEFYDQYMRDRLHLYPAHKLWLRNVLFEPKQENCEKWIFWQFANRARLEGIKGPVDLNVFCGTRDLFRKTFGRSED